MDIQEQYDELDNIVSSIDVLISEISNTYYIDMLNDLKFEAMNEREQLKDDYFLKNSNHIPYI